MKAVVVLCNLSRAVVLLDAFTALRSRTLAADLAHQGRRPRGSRQSLTPMPSLP